MIDLVASARPCSFFDISHMWACCLVLCCKPVIILGQLHKDLLQGHRICAQGRKRTLQKDSSSFLHLHKGMGQDLCACVPSRRPKFHDFPRIPIRSQVIYSVVIHKALIKTHGEHRGRILSAHPHAIYTKMKIHSKYDSPHAPAVI